MKKPPRRLLAVRRQQAVSNLGPAIIITLNPWRREPKTFPKGSFFFDPIKPARMDFQYNEIIKKDGKRIIFCNLEELLMKEYELTSPEELPARLDSSGKEYICHCPFCRAEGHTKHKLYIKSDLTTGHCFVCTRAFIGITDELDMKIPEYNPLPGYFTRTGVEVVPLTDPTWRLDRFNSEFDDTSDRGKAYLSTRHPYMVDLASALGWKYWDGNIVMPFRWKGEVIYYQIRFSSGKSRIRYFFPPISAKPPYVIEHLPVVPGQTKVIIVEGVYDAVSCLIQAPEYIPFAVLGSSISEYQMKFLRELLPGQIVVYMDDTEKSKQVAQRIRSVIYYADIRIIPSDGTDPEEGMNKRLHWGKDIQWVSGYIEKQQQNDQIRNSRNKNNSLYRRPRGSKLSKG